MIKVIIAVGTGFVGQGIIQLLSPKKIEVHSLSCHKYKSHPTDKTIYHVVNLSNSSELQHIIVDADWVIDAVGILLPNPIKGIAYRNSSYEPARHLIDQLIKQASTNFLLISANSGLFYETLSKRKKSGGKTNESFIAGTCVHCLSGYYL